MSKFEQIQQQIASLEPSFETETIELKNAFGRILQEDIFADCDMPPFDKSAMDGYACRMTDISNELRVLEIVNAGKVPEFEITENTCAKIMTGAMVPSGANCVFKIEDSVQADENFVRCTNLSTRTNICYRGEDYKTADVLLKKGTLLSVSQLAVLAGAGYPFVIVSVKPTAAIIATGSELVEPGEDVQAGKIRNSNATQLAAQLQKIGIIADYFGIATDDKTELTKVFSAAIENHNFIFFTGGASNGDFDHVPQILKENGFQIHWNTTSMKPGNPMTFAQKDKKYCFGLSGNPVSSLVQFEIIAKPILYKLMGSAFEPLRIKTVLASDYRRKQVDRLELVPVSVNNDGQAELIPFNGSAHINALVFANALMEVPQGINEIKTREMIYVRPL